MGLGTQTLRLPRKEDAHFLSLIGGGAVLMTVFFLFISTASEQAQYDDGGTTSHPPEWKRSSIQRQGGRSTQSYIGSEAAFISSRSRGTLAAEHERTLVVYFLSNSDSIYRSNLNYFVRTAVAATDACDYVFVIQGVESPQDTSALPRLPINARYLYTQKAGCETGLGLASEAFGAGGVKKEDYRYFIFISSSVRGPFVPPYALDDQHWSHYFTQKLNDRVKLVGPTIHCQPLAGMDGPAPPHVQFTAMATDQVGLGVLEAAKTVLRCHNGSVDEHLYSEMGASAAILRANYSLDSFMTRYRKVDWTDKRNWDCNQQKDPLPEFNYDGSSIHPYETIFVPMDTVAIENGWSFAKLSALYETWLTLQDRGDNEVVSNAWVSDPWPIKRQRIAYMQSRGPGCFDNHYYLQKNPDLKVIPTVLELWDHFVMMGQFEGRSFRWSCEDDRKLPWE